MTTESKTTAPVKPTRTQVWLILAGLLADPDNRVIGVRMHPGDISVAIEVAPDSREAVDAVIAALAMPPGYLDDEVFCEGEPFAFRVYGHHLGRASVSTLLPGWQVAVTCDVSLSRAGAFDSLEASS